jgi:ribonuclease PH
MSIDSVKRDTIRDVEIIPRFLTHLRSSVFIKMGNTHVLCTAVVEDKVPGFLKGTGIGWITAEYGMLPCASSVRADREAVKGRQRGRTHEIQRLIGRALRAVVDLSSIGERTIKIDCDVIQADGGTRTASITGAFVAMYELFREMREKQEIKDIPVTEFVAAISVGIIDGQLLLDLNYQEDSNADVDINVVMTETGKVVEIQGTAEHNPFTLQELDELIKLGNIGVKKLISIQKQVLGIT